MLRIGTLSRAAKKGGRNIRCPIYGKTEPR